jgi:hypothetical protein
MYYTVADESRTKLVSRMFKKLVGATVKCTMHHNVGKSLLKRMKKKQMKKYEAVLELLRRVWGVGADPPWPDKGASKALLERGLLSLAAIRFPVFQFCQP